MPIKSTLLILLVACSITGAQAMMPIPPYGHTLSHATTTGGFYFQAPRAFTIVGWRVPNEKNVLQAGCSVYVMSTPPPAYPATRVVTPWLAAAYFLASKIQTCSVPVNKGEWVGILGACGDSQILHNSNAAAMGPFRSDVVGVATTLRGFGTRTNMMVAMGMGPHYADDNGYISRVEIYVNVMAAKLTGPATAAPGTTVGLSLSARSDGGLPYQVGSSFGQGPIYLGNRLVLLSMDDLLLISVLGWVPTMFRNYSGLLTVTGGSASASIVIPNASILKGIQIHSAFLTLAASAPSGISNISNTYTFTIW